jgi:hypothetical protein
MHEVGPLIPRELNGRDGGNDLCGGLAGLRVGRTEGLKGELLDTRLGVLIRLLNPFAA